MNNISVDILKNFLESQVHEEAHRLKIVQIYQCEPKVYFYNLFQGEAMIHIRKENYQYMFVYFFGQYAL